MQLIELKQNPRASEHRVRATLKTFKKNYHEEAFGAAASSCRDIHGNIIGRGYGINLGDKIKLLMDENVKQRSSLKEKTYELEALTSKYRKIQSMIQSGQYLQAINATAGTSISGISTMNLNAPAPSGTVGSTGVTCIGASGGGGGTGAATSAQMLHGNQTTLTSRSPTREFAPPLTDSSKEPLRPSEQLPVGIACQASATAVAAAVAGAAALATANEQRKQWSSTKSAAADEPTTGLRSSPLMSSITHITTTNTTSSTNNHTELTTDYSTQSRLTGQTTSATTGTGSSAATCASAANVVAPNELSSRLRGRKAPGSRAAGTTPCSAASGRLNRSQKPAGGELESPVRVTKYSTADSGNGGSERRSPRQTTDSSYCSIGIAHDSSTITTKVSSTTKLSSLFTIERAANVREEDETSLSQWLEGPFCALMVRNSDRSSKGRRSRAITGNFALSPDKVFGQRNSLERNKHERDSGSNILESREDTSNASCPDLHVALLGSQRRQSNKTQPCKQSEQRHAKQANLDGDTFSTASLATGTKLDAPASATARARGQTAQRGKSLPRTLSMIEYLGLNEIEMIARRHEQPSAQSDRQQVGQRHKQSVCYGSAISCNYCAHNRHSAKGLIQSPGNNNNLSDRFVSDEQLDSEDMMQTYSRDDSCSTCCSLATHSYASQSDFFRDNQMSRSSRSTSTQSISSLLSKSSAENSQQQPYHSDPSQSISRSSSTVNHVAIATPVPVKYCPLHQQQALQQQRQSHRQESLGKQSQQQQQQQHALVHKHSHHHNSSETISSASSTAIVNVSVTQQQQQQQQHSCNDDADKDAKFLCTSGLFYGAPSAKEDANGAVAIDQSLGVTPSGFDDTQDNVDNIDTVQQRRDSQIQPVSIRCDILEKL